MTKILEILGLCIIMMISLSFITGCEDAEDVIHSDSKPVAIVSFGNPNVSKAVEDPSVKIQGLKINGMSGMSYSYCPETKSLWGLPDNEAGALAIMGYEKDGVYHCGKYDWISKSRRTRDFKNINTGYNGWNPTEFYAAKKHCFFIMSKDGKKRTNIIFDN